MSDANYQILQLKSRCYDVFVNMREIVQICPPESESYRIVVATKVNFGIELGYKSANQHLKMAIIE